MEEQCDIGKILELAEMSMLIGDLRKVLGDERFQEYYPEASEWLKEWDDRKDEVKNQLREMTRACGRPLLSIKMPRIDPHATALKQDVQLKEQMRWLKQKGFKTAREAQEAGY